MARTYFINMSAQPENGEEVAKVTDALTRMAAGLLLDGIETNIYMSVDDDEDEYIYDQEMEDEPNSGTPEED